MFLESPVEYQGRWPATMTQGVTVRSTELKSASRKSSCWVGVLPKGPPPRFALPPAASGAEGKSVSVSIMTICAIPYSKEYQKGGFARA